MSDIKLPAKSATLGSARCANSLETCSMSPLIAAKCNGVSPLSLRSLERDKFELGLLALPSPLFDVICMSRAICCLSDIGVTGGGRLALPDPLGRIDEGIFCS